MLKVGWVGAGFVGQSAHLESVSRFSDVSIEAIAELRPELSKHVCQSFNIPRSYENHQKMIESENFDAVFVVVNRRHTFEVAFDVLSAGINLFTEKPMAQTFEDAKKLVKIAKEKNLTYSVGYMRRYDDGVRKGRELIRELVDSGEIGNIVSVRMFVEAGSDYCGIRERITTGELRPETSTDRIAPKWIPSSYHLEYEHFVNVCGHDINLLRFLFSDEPKVVSVEYRKDGFSYVVLRFPRFSGIFEWGYRKSDVDGWRESVEVRFERGQVNINLPPAFLRNVSAQVELRRESRPGFSRASESIISGDFSWAFENSDRAFLDAVRKKIQADNSGLDAINDFILIDDVWRKILEGARK